MAKRRLRKGLSAPGLLREAFALAPEPIVKGDGAKKDDCERNAANRLLSDVRRDLRRPLPGSVSVTAQSFDVRPEHIGVAKAGQHSPQPGEEPPSVQIEHPFDMDSQLFAEITGAAERLFQTEAAGNRWRPEIVGQKFLHAFDARKEEREMHIDVEGVPRPTDGPVRKGPLFFPPPDRPDRRRPVLEGQGFRPVKRSCGGQVRHLQVHDFVQQGFRRLPRCGVHDFAGDEHR